MFKINYFFMNPNKRPRPAIPLLVHVDNPTEAASVTVDTSAVEGKLNTVISNQERIYEKIPTSTGGGGGGSADMTTVNNNTNEILKSIGKISNTQSVSTLIGLGINIRNSLGHYDLELDPSADSARGLLYNIKGAVGDSTETPSSTGYSVRDLMVQQKNMSASIREHTTTLTNAIGTTTSGGDTHTLVGLTKNIKSAVGDWNGSINPSGNSVRDSLYNVKMAIGDLSRDPSSTGNSVRDLLTAIKANTASGGGGGGGGSADLTIVNEKTTALATAIGTADDTSSTVSVIGLLKSITDKY